MSDRTGICRRPTRTWRTAGATVAFAAATIVAAVTVVGCTGNAGTAKTNAAAHVAKQVTATQSPGTDNANAVLAELLQLGITQAEQHGWAAAETTFGDVLAIDPRNVYALYNLGLVDESTGNIPGADAYYEQAIADDADYTPALYNLAFTLESSNPEKALSLYQKIVSINPQASTAYLRMAFVYAQRGDLTQAHADQAKAIAIDPSLGRYPLPAAK
jgi:Tfp pilus assembly protein PilF